MTELSKIQATDEELKKANNIHCFIHTTKPMQYKEEYEECSEEVSGMSLWIAKMWEKIRDNDGIESTMTAIKYHALHAAAEAIQVAAMCDKFLMTKDTYLHGWIKCKDPSELAPETICRFCAASPDECGEYPDICYKGVMKELK